MMSERVLAARPPEALGGQVPNTLLGWNALGTCVDAHSRGVRGQIRSDVKEAFADAVFETDQPQGAIQLS